MKRLCQILLGLMLLGQSAHAAEMALEIELPDTQLLLPPVSPPHLQKEGLPLLREQADVTELLTLIGSGGYEAALSLVRERYTTVLMLLEEGDPAGLLPQRAVPGVIVHQMGEGAPRTAVSAALLYLVGHVYFALEQYLPAETAFKAALVPLPDYLRVHESLGLLYLHTEHYAEARVHLTRAAELGLNTAALHGALGYLNQQTRNYWGAMSAFQRALVMEHDNRNWQRGLLHALSETYQYRSALALVEQMLQADPDDSDLWLYRAHISLLEDQSATALASLETAIRLGDDSVANKQVCATLHLEWGSIGRAVELLKSAYAQGMDFQFLDQALGRLAQQGDWDELRTLLAVAGNRESLAGAEQSKLLTREASLHLHDGETQAASSALQQAVDIDPSNAEALMALGHLHRDDRDYNRAELLFQRASAYGSYRENALVSLAQLAIDQENFERALELLRAVVNSNPARTDLRRSIDSLENLVLLRTNN